MVGCRCSGKLVDFLCLNCLYHGGSFPRQIHKCKGYSSLSVPRPDGGPGFVDGYESSGGLREWKYEKNLNFCGYLFLAARFCLNSLYHERGSL